MIELAERNATAITDKLDTSTVSDKPRLLDQMRALIRVKHYSMRTERGMLMPLFTYSQRIM